MCRPARKPAERKPQQPGIDKASGDCPLITEIGVKLAGISKIHAGVFSQYYPGKPSHVFLPPANLVGRDTRGSTAASAAVSSVSPWA